MKRPDVDPRQPYSVALRMLAGRELSERQLRERLAKRGFPADAIADAAVRLKASRAVDDTRVALALARTHVRIKRHGRARVLRELEAIGIAREIARAAVADVFADVDEPHMIAQAIARRRRHTGTIEPAEFRRLHAYLIRQGFPADAVVRALRARGGSQFADEG